MSFWKRKKQATPAAEGMSKPERTGRPSQVSQETQAKILGEVRKNFADFQELGDPSRHQNPAKVAAAKLLKSINSRQIISSMQELGNNYALLDTEGQATGHEIKQAVLGYIRAEGEEEARKKYKGLKNGTVLRATGKPVEMFDPDTTVRMIKEDFEKIRTTFAKAGEKFTPDYSVLEPESGHGHHVMVNKVLPEVVKKAHIRQARLDFEELKEGLDGTTAILLGVMGASHSPKGKVDSIRSHLQKAGADLSALDPTGQTTAADMEEELQKALKNHKYTPVDKKDIDVIRSFPRNDGRSR